MCAQSACMCVCLSVCVSVFVCCVGGDGGDTCEAAWRRYVLTSVSRRRRRRRWRWRRCWWRWRGRRGGQQSSTCHCSHLPESFRHPVPPRRHAGDRVTAQLSTRAVEENATSLHLAAKVAGSVAGSGRVAVWQGGTQSGAIWAGWARAGEPGWTGTAGNSLPPPPPPPPSPPPPHNTWSLARAALRWESDSRLGIVCARPRASPEPRPRDKPTTSPVRTAMKGNVGVGSTGKTLSSTIDLFSANANYPSVKSPGGVWRANRDPPISRSV